jgi:FixJ family two-component response regulator
MPGMTGRAMADQVVAQRPETKVLYVSGYGDLANSETNAAFLQKPFTTADLARKIRELLKEPA